MTHTVLQPLHFSPVFSEEEMTHSRDESEMSEVIGPVTDNVAVDVEEDSFNTAG